MGQWAIKTDRGTRSYWIKIFRLSKLKDQPNIGYEVSEINLKSTFLWFIFPFHMTTDKKGWFYVKGTKLVEAKGKTVKHAGEHKTTHN